MRLSSHRATCFAPAAPHPAFGPAAAQHRLQHVTIRHKDVNQVCLASPRNGGVVLLPPDSVTTKTCGQLLIVHRWHHNSHDMLAGGPPRCHSLLPPTPDTHAPSAAFLLQHKEKHCHCTCPHWSSQHLASIPTVDKGMHDYCLRAHEATLLQ